MGDDEAKTVNKSTLNLKDPPKTKSVGAFGSKSMSRMRIRKHSYGFGAVPGIKPIERTSQVAIEFKRPPLLYLNTYQLDPHPHAKFHLQKVKQATDEILDESWTGHKYNVQDSPALALRLAGEIMRRIKAMQFNRYRLITVVTIGQKRAQSYNNAISFLWDHERDNYVDIQREENTTFIQALSAEPIIGILQLVVRDAGEDIAYLSSRKKSIVPDGSTNAWQSYKCNKDVRRYVAHIRR